MAAKESPIIDTLIPKPAEIIEARFDLAIVIPARDEASILEATLSRLLPMVHKREQIHVVADHCRDRTARVAAKAGVRVHVRKDGGPVGKGPALHWWLQRTRALATPDQVILVLDADSRVHPGFFEGLETHFFNGNLAAQARIEPFATRRTKVSMLASLSEIVEHKISDPIRSRMGWSVRLRGTGMAFRRGLLESYSKFLHTEVEDLELTMLIGAAGIPITYLPDIVVVDPKPEDTSMAVRQRARWLKGQFQVIRSYPSQILRLILIGPRGWSLLASGLLKPKTLILPLKMAAVVGFSTFAVRLGQGWYLWALFAALGILSICLDVVVFLYALRYLDYPVSSLSAIVGYPAYFILWLRSLALSRLQRQAWLRSRRSDKESSPVQPHSIH